MDEAHVYDMSAVCEYHLNTNMTVPTSNRVGHAWPSRLHIFVPLSPHMPHAARLHPKTLSRHHGQHPYDTAITANGIFEAPRGEWNISRGREREEG